MRIKTASAISISFLIVGCTNMNTEEFVESFSYPPDTPILIDDIPYQINTTKCAEIRGINSDRSLNCYAVDGSRSAQITPIPDFRRNMVEEENGFEWASPQHIAMVYSYFHLGGKEELQRQLANSLKGFVTATSVLDLSDTIEAHQEYEQESFRRKVKGINIYQSQGFNAWMDHQDSLFDWHMNNARVFLEH
ncbi:hypothetical protein OFO16_14380 [Vibrio natriegens]|uniref:hypothetical protein n=1 Tax=Vibrio natriegens TaxID=691 RepID=UPI0021E90501|nr:hypothetical protein [Vibrio natriegens]UYI46957.1 hypothetical protein OFO16_14380 [Vibrio natriegens]